MCGTDAVRVSQFFAGIQSNFKGKLHDLDGVRNVQMPLTVCEYRFLEFLYI